MNVKVISFTQSAEKLASLAAKLCYNSKDLELLVKEVNLEESSKFIEKVVGFGHESIVEHVSFSFLVDGVSRALLAQITRHRIASYSVRSQRYVLEDCFSYVIPSEIEKDPVAKEIFLKFIENSRKSYEDLLKILKEKHMKKYIDEGYEEKKAKKMAQKLAAEDARFVLPNACQTSFIVTMNARSLLNFFRLRCCNRAQWEIRNLAFEMLRNVYPLAPSIFKNAGPPCVNGCCKEGVFSCNKADFVREKIKKIKGDIDKRSGKVNSF